MGKSRNGRISRRQLSMLEMRYQGMSLSEIGKHFGITGEGVRVNVNVAARMIGKHGLSAIPDGCTTIYTAEQLSRVGPKQSQNTLLAGADSAGLLSARLPAHYPRAKEPRSIGDRFIRINGKEFSFEEVAKALGVAPPAENGPEQFQLCQRVDAGILTAQIYDFGGDYPGIDVDLHLPEMAHSLPVMISRTEQPHSDGKENPVRTFGYSRNEEYFMYFDTDTRPDRELDSQQMLPSVVISGDPGYSVDVWTENSYMNYKGCLPAQTVRATEASNLLGMSEKVAYYRGNIAEQITVLVDSGYCTSDQQTYLEEHLDEITEQYVVKCDAWEAENGCTAPLDVELDIIHKEILNAAKKAPVKSLDAQIDSARDRAEVIGSSAAFQEIQARNH